jgi:hypothetical protein
LDAIEKQLAVLTAERTRIETELSAGATSATLIDRFGPLSAEITSLETRWMEVGSAIELAETATATLRNTLTGS